MVNATATATQLAIEDLEGALLMRDRLPDPISLTKVGLALYVCHDLHISTHAIHTIDNPDTIFLNQVLTVCMAFDGLCRRMSALPA